MINKKVLVTGAQGFIGYHLCQKLLDLDYYVIGVDSSFDGLVDWPEDKNPIMKKIKNDRLKTLLSSQKNFHFYNQSIGNLNIKELKDKKFSVVNLAARAGIPFSRIKPIFYECDNVLNFAKLLYYLKDFEVKNFVYASSSSVYGGVDNDTGCTEDMDLNPLNIYANTKMYNEMQAKIYGEIYNIPVTGLRFFTVYGTMGRIDMAIFKWVSAIMANEPVLLNNSGKMFRDFTPVENIVDGIILALEKPQKYKIYNLGYGQSVKIIDIISLIEKYTGLHANKKMLPYPVGEVYKSLANVTLAKEELGFNPTISIENGLEKYIEWYKEYFIK